MVLVLCTKTCEKGGSCESCMSEAIGRSLIGEATMIRVLYVDDEPDIREIALLALSLAPDLDARGAASGAEALQIAAEWLPHIILLDVMMPGLDGPATLGKLREEPATAGVPVVFITARAQSHDLQSFAATGARGVIAKPFDPITLAQQVQSFLL